MTSDETAERAIPRALELLWRAPSPARRAGGLSRERIVTAAIELADSEGLGALSMARLAERLDCGTMSLYRHVASKDELVVFMLSSAPGPPPPPSDVTNWRRALADWADGLWDVYHRHPWILHTATAGPPADPGQLAWLEAGLGALAGTPLPERDKLVAVMALLHFVRGTAALAIEAGPIDPQSYPELLSRLVDAARFPALTAALDAGVFSGDTDDPRAELRSGLAQLLDGIEVKFPTGR